MATKISPKVEERVIPPIGGFTTWLELGELLPVAIQTPSQWTAGNVVVKARMRSTGTGSPVWDDNPTAATQITIAAAADRFIRLDERLFLGATALAFAADGQTAPRTLSIALLPSDMLLGDR